MIPESLEDFLNCSDSSDSMSSFENKNYLKEFENEEFEISSEEFEENSFDFKENLKRFDQGNKSEENEKELENTPENTPEKVQENTQENNQKTHQNNNQNNKTKTPSKLPQKLKNPFSLSKQITEFNAKITFLTNELNQKNNEIEKLKEEVLFVENIKIIKNENNQENSTKEIHEYQKTIKELENLVHGVNFI